MRVLADYHHHDLWESLELLAGRLFLHGTSLRNGFFGDDCLVSSSGGLAWSVAPGIGGMRVNISA